MHGHLNDKKDICVQKVIHLVMFQIYVLHKVSKLFDGHGCELLHSRCPVP